MPLNIARAIPGKVDPVFRPELRKNKKIERFTDSVRVGTALVEWTGCFPGSQSARLASAPRVGRLVKIAFRQSCALESNYHCSVHIDSYFERAVQQPLEVEPRELIVGPFANLGRECSQRSRVPALQHAKGL